MEIDITDFFENGNPFEFSASNWERGVNAGPETWANALDEARKAPLLKTEGELQALRDHVQARGFGEEVQGYDADKCNALFIQLISGDMREAGLDADSGYADWMEYEEDDSASHNIFRGVDGRVYYYLGE